MNEITPDVDLMTRCRQALAKRVGSVPEHPRRRAEIITPMPGPPDPVQIKLPQRLAMDDTTNEAPDDPHRLARLFVAQDCTSLAVDAALLRMLLEPGQVVELRALQVVEQDGSTTTHSGFFDTDHLSELVTAADKLAQQGKGAFWTLNPVRPDLLARRANHESVASRDELTSDKDIVRRRWLLVDVDPRRPSGVSATDAEKKQARQVANAVEAFLFDAGWPEPIRADSGNGFHLLYRIDLPADDDGLVKRCLHALAHEFDNEHASVDTSVFNPSRICKVPGTMARKGSNTKERPHRRAQILSQPGQLELVSLEQLQRLASEAPQKAPHHVANGNGDAARPFIPDEAVRLSRSYLEKIPPAISGQRGHDVTFHAAGVLVQGFGLSQDQAFPLLAEWNRMCQPPWSEQELRHKLDDAAKQPGPRGELLKGLNQPPPPPLNQADSRSAHVATVTPHAPSTPSAFKLNLISSAQFAAAEYRQHFLVKRILVEGQPCVLGGAKKTLKTSILVDLALSLGTGTPFLGCEDFAVPIPVNVLMLSGESGSYTLQETARRVAKARGQSLSTARISWGFTLPQLADRGHLAVLANQIREHGTKVAIIDPAYLCLLSSDTSSNITSNVFAMGQLLKGLSEIGHETGCTIIIAHHTRKGDRQNLYGVPDLNELSGSGFAEWARQWLLLNRREEFQAGSGEHRLWMNVGGSAGHSGTWGLDISEGVPDDSFQGRTWSVAIQKAMEVVQQSRSVRQQQRNHEKQEKLSGHIERIRDVLRKATGPLAKTRIRDLSGINSVPFGTAFSILLDTNELESVDYKGRKNRTFSGWVLKGTAAGQPDNSAGQPDSPAAYE